MRYAIYGAGGFAREVMPVVRRAVSAPDIVFVDDTDNCARSCNGRPVITFQELRTAEHRDRKVLVAIASSATREAIESRCSNEGLEITSVIAPTAILMDDVSIGQGAIICDGVTITSNVVIGKGFHANLHSYVAHDCRIGDYVTFAPKVGCNGNVHIGNHVYVGAGAFFIQGSTREPLTVGDGSIVGMGAIVTKPVPPQTVVVGNPARVIRILEK